METHWDASPSRVTVSQPPKVFRRVLSRQTLNLTPGRKKGFITTRFYYVSVTGPVSDRVIQDKTDTVLTLS